jgi:HAE1 family hydrophobic/amphiphilic exporter-1
VGNRDYAMRFWLKPDRMLAYKISADEVMEALSQQSLEASPGKTGKVQENDLRHLSILKYSGRFTTKEQYGNIILKSSPEKYPFERCC